MFFGKIKKQSTSHFKKHFYGFSSDFSIFSDFSHFGVPFLKSFDIHGPYLKNFFLINHMLCSREPFLYMCVCFRDQFTVNDLKLRSELNLT